MYVCMYIYIHTHAHIRVCVYRYMFWVRPVLIMYLKVSTLCPSCPSQLCPPQITLTILYDKGVDTATLLSIYPRPTTEGWTESRTDAYKTWDLIGSTQGRLLSNSEAISSLFQDINGWNSLTVFFSEYLKSQRNVFSVPHARAVRGSTALYSFTRLYIYSLYMYIIHLLI